MPDTERALNVGKQLATAAEALETAIGALDKAKNDVHIVVERLKHVLEPEKAKPLPPPMEHTLLVDHSHDKKTKKL